LPFVTISINEIEERERAEFSALRKVQNDKHFSRTSRQIASYRSMSTRDIIVIGASAGGLEALQQLAAGLPRDLQAAVFITLHLSSTSIGLLPSRLNKTGPLPAAHAEDGEMVRPGRIYTAPPDYHLVLEDSRVLLSHGPKENLQRPGINVMFRSAAAVYGPRVIGVLLTGLLDDGAAGLWEIQQRGGMTVVQDPEEAQFRSMPESAINGLNVQYIVRLAEMGPLLRWLTIEDRESLPEPHPEPVLEPSSQSCPLCGGAMATVQLGDLREYRCHIGHRFGLKSLIAEKREVVESALSTALSQSEELTALLELSLAEPSDSPDPDELLVELSERKSEQETLRTLCTLSGIGKTVRSES
jgi:two-component system, chemotaxis family, protein-glutamate methylesterase/glutaminase